MGQGAQKNKERYKCIVDVSASRKSGIVLTESLVEQAFARFGSIVNIFPWNSRTKGAHFYVEFDSAHAVELARTMPPWELVTVSITNDRGHHIRFNSLASNNRYAPYDIPAQSQASTSVPYPRSVSANEENHDHFSPFHQLPPSIVYASEDRQSRRNSLSDLSFQTSPQNPPFGLPDLHVDGNGTFETPFSISSSNSSTSEIPSVSPINLLSNAQGSMPLETHFPISSNHSGRSSAAEDLIERLTAARDAKLTERTSNGPTRDLKPLRINPRFDFRGYITSGNFLITDQQPSSAGTSQSFQLTPLQAYFADVYANLQTELADTKKKQKLRLLQLLEQKKLCDGLKKELESERAARREAERALNTLQLAQTQAVAAAHTPTQEDVLSQLEAARQEVDELKRTIAHIRSICAPPLDPTTATGDSI